MDKIRESIILRQLVADYRQIAFQFKVPLKLPLIMLVDHSSLWGRWDPLKRTIELRRSLVDECSWDTVLYVLKHEMAHQIVSEVFHLSHSDHQESFQRACDLLCLPHFFRRASGDLSQADGWQGANHQSDKLSQIIKKIQKLFSLTASTNEAEASLALERAQELMRKHNIQDSTLQQETEDFYYIIISTGKARLSPIYSHLASILIDYYSVDVVFTKSFDVKRLDSFQSLEIYGRKSNVIVAEYVFHFLFRTLEDLWKEHRDHQKKSLYLKKSFLLGVLNGFSEKLKKIESPPDIQGQKLVTLKKALILEKQELRAFVSQRYPRLGRRSGRGSGIDGSLYRQGQTYGESLHVNAAMAKAGKKLLLQS